MRLNCSNSKAKKCKVAVKNTSYLSDRQSPNIRYDTLEFVLHLKKKKYQVLNFTVVYRACRYTATVAIKWANNKYWFLFAGHTKLLQNKLNAINSIG